MKIFQNYQSKKKLKQSNEELKNKLKNTKKELSTSYDRIQKLTAEVENSMVSIKSFEQEIERLTNIIDDLDYKLKESMTDKYLVKKIPSGRPPHTAKMKVKSCTKTSSICKKMHQG